MTKEKWDEIFKKECKDCHNKTPIVIDAGNYFVFRELLMNLVKNVDELTEVYNMEKGE